MATRAERTAPGARKQARMSEIAVATGQNFAGKVRRRNLEPSFEHAAVYEFETTSARMRQENENLFFDRWFART